MVATRLVKPRCARRLLGAETVQRASHDRTPGMQRLGSRPGGDNPSCSAQQLPTAGRGRAGCRIKSLHVPEVPDRVRQQAKKAASHLQPPENFKRPMSGGRAAALLNPLLDRPPAAPALRTRQRQLLNPSLGGSRACAAGLGGHRRHRRSGRHQPATNSCSPRSSTTTGDGELRSRVRRLGRASTSRDCMLLARICGVASAGYQEDTARTGNPLVWSRTPTNNRRE